MFSNGFVLFIPIFIWNLVFWKKLPPEFENKAFDADIPKFILAVEAILRMVVFLMPLFMMLDYSNSLGLCVFVFGVIIYFLSWALLMANPNSKWSKSLIGFTAPAYTPIIWLVGFALLAKSFYFHVSYKAWFYIGPSFLFVFFHFLHSKRAYENSRNAKTV